MELYFEPNTEIDPMLYVKCRLCVKETGSFRIHQILQEKIKNCFDITVTHLDGLPQLICRKCKTMLSDYADSKKSFVENQTVLVQKFKESVPASSAKNVDEEFTQKLNNHDEKDTKEAKTEPQIIIDSSSEDEAVLEKQKILSTNSVSEYEISQTVHRSDCVTEASEKGNDIQKDTSTSGELGYDKELLTKHCKVKIEKKEITPNLTGSHETAVLAPDNIVCDEGSVKNLISYSPMNDVSQKAYVSKRSTTATSKRILYDDSSNNEDDVDDDFKPKQNRRRHSRSSSKDTVIIDTVIIDDIDDNTLDEGHGKIKRKKSLDSHDASNDSPANAIPGNQHKENTIDDNNVEPQNVQINNQNDSAQEVRISFDDDVSDLNIVATEASVANAQAQLICNSDISNTKSTSNICEKKADDVLYQNENKLLNANPVANPKQENISKLTIPNKSHTKLKIRKTAKGKLYVCPQNSPQSEDREVYGKTKKGNTDQQSSSENEIIPQDQEPDPSEDITWLKNCSEPFDMVIGKWKNTFKMRRAEILKNPKTSTAEYMKKYPSLQKPTGFHLLVDDFKNLFPDSIDKLKEEFPVYKYKILDLTLKKFGRHLDVNAKKLTEECLKIGNQESSDLVEATSILAFMYLPLLLRNPLRNIKKTTRRPSVDESREAFITHLTAATELNWTIAARKEKYAKHGLTFQPTIFIVGPTIKEIEAYYIVVDDTFYVVNSILEAVDVIFKLYHALHCEYPIECETVYSFLQKAFYKFSTNWDKKFIGVNALLADLNIG